MPKSKNSTTGAQPQGYVESSVAESRHMPIISRYALGHSIHHQLLQLWARQRYILPNHTTQPTQESIPHKKRYLPEWEHGQVKGPQTVENAVRGQSPIIQIHKVIRIGSKHVFHNYTSASPFSVEKAVVRGLKFSGGLIEYLGLV